jgi:hypothetical protein
MARSEPSTRELEDALSLQRDLAEAFALAPERSDAESLDEIRRLCELARITVNDGPCHDFLRLIERHAEGFFVTDDNVHWDWHTPGRYAKLRALLIRLVSALGLRVCCLQIRQRSAEVSERTRRAALKLPHARADAVSRVGEETPME